MKKNNNNQLINSRWKSFVKPIFTFFVIAIPALLIWVFFSTDFPFAEHWNLNYEWWIKLLIGIAFVIGTFLITALFVSLRMLDMSVFSFSIPVSVSFMTIFITDQLVAWARALIIIPIFLLIIPVVIYTKKIETKLAIRKRKKIEKSNEKIIGHK